MRQIYFVREEEAALARVMEAKLVSLPRESGILFVGVSVEPGEKPTYHVWLGIDRSFDEKVADPLVRVTLRQELPPGTSLKVEAHRGILRALSLA